MWKYSNGILFGLNPCLHLCIHIIFEQKLKQKEKCNILQVNFGILILSLYISSLLPWQYYITKTHKTSGVYKNNYFHSSPFSLAGYYAHLSCTGQSSTIGQWSALDWVGSFAELGWALPHVWGLSGPTRRTQLYPMCLRIDQCNKIIFPESSEKDKYLPYYWSVSG